MQEKWAPYDANLLAPLIFSGSRKNTGKHNLHRACQWGRCYPNHPFPELESSPAWEMHGRDLSGLLDNPASSLD